jgi:hypothetical protein
MTLADAHCMLCGRMDQLKAYPHERNGNLVGVLFACNRCKDIMVKGELQWTVLIEKDGRN